MSEPQTFPQTLVKGELTRVVVNQAGLVKAKFDGFKPQDAETSEPESNPDAPAADAPAAPKPRKPSANIDTASDVPTPDGTGQ